MAITAASGVKGVYMATTAAPGVNMVNIMHMATTEYNINIIIRTSE